MNCHIRTYNSTVCAFSKINIFFFENSRPRSAGFIRSQLISIHAVIHPHDELLIMKLHSSNDLNSEVNGANNTKY